MPRRIKPPNNVTTLADIAAAAQAMRQLCAEWLEVNEEFEDFDAYEAVEALSRACGEARDVDEW